MLFKRSWAALLATVGGLAVGVQATSAQTVYAPVQSQYRTANATFYYAGADPYAIAAARAAVECFYRSGQPGGFDGTRAYAGRTYGVGLIHRGLIGRPPEYTVSDCAPGRNAFAYGYTAVDARNEAYARVPRFFRMADLSASAVGAEDGRGVVVPAQAAGTIEIRAYQRPAAASRPSTQPRPVLIIPKDALEKKSEPKDSVVSVES